MVLVNSEWNRWFFGLDRVVDMLPGLLAGQEKMSKSDPNSAIFMEDDEVRSSTVCYAVYQIWLAFVDHC